MIMFLQGDNNKILNYQVLTRHCLRRGKYLACQFNNYTASIFCNVHTPAVISNIFADKNTIEPNCFDSTTTNGNYNNCDGT